MLFAWPPTFGAKSWRSNAIFFAFASFRVLKAWNSENPRKANGIFCFGQAPKKPKKLQKMKLYKTSKQTNIRQKAWKRKNSKIWNWKNLEAHLKLLCCLCVLDLLQVQEYKKIIWENLMQEIRVPNTPFLRNQAWMRNFKHNYVPFSHKKHLFTHTCCRAERI